VIRTDRNGDPLDGSADDLADDTGLLICQGIAMIVFVVSVIFYALSLSLG
jgi:hypothetical protein